MNISQSLIRVFFLLISVVICTAYAATLTPDYINFLNLILGIIAGVGFGFLLICLETLLNKYSLKSFNLAMLGLLFGYLMGQALILILGSIVDLDTLPLLKVGVFLPTCYLGMVLTARASDEIYASIPFIKLKPTSIKKKDILLDASILADSRIIDLASSGLLDNQLMLPRFILKDLQELAANEHDAQNAKARRCLEVIQKLESIPGLDLSYTDTNFPEIKEMTSKLIRLARMLDANILTADISRIEQAAIESIRIINIHALSNALKPLTQYGENLKIKIQRYGKEERQGVGYLEDGTMVVVNGGAEYIGNTIKAQVLSVKHTSSGRMIFCNTTEESILSGNEAEESLANIQSSAKNYFTL